MIEKYAGEHVNQSIINNQSITGQTHQYNNMSIPHIIDITYM